jgi:hypothetical protein
MGTLKYSDALGCAEPILANPFLPLKGAGIGNSTLLFDLFFPSSFVGGLLPPPYLSPPFNILSPFAPYSPCGRCSLSFSPYIRLAVGALPPFHLSVSLPAGRFF